MIRLCFLFWISFCSGWQLSRRHAIGALTVGYPTALWAEEVEQEDFSADPFVIRFYGEVTDASCLELVRALNMVDARGRTRAAQYPGVEPHISLHIQSEGGELLPALYVCDTIQSLKTPVYTYVDGFAASAASLISVCGAQRFMTKHSAILVHQIKGGASGKFDELQDEMINFNLFMNNTKDIYLKNTRLKEDELDRIMRTETWLNAETCLRHGLVDGIV